jgi:hypothetical protein
MNERPNHMIAGMVFITACVLIAGLLYAGLRAHPHAPQQSDQTYNSQAASPADAPEPLEQAAARLVVPSQDSAEVADDDVPCAGTWHGTLSADGEERPLTIAIGTDTGGTVRFTISSGDGIAESGEAVLPASIPNVVNYYTADGATSYSLECASPPVAGLTIEAQDRRAGLAIGQQLSVRLRKKPE